MRTIATDFEYKGRRPDAKTIGIVAGTFAPLHAGHKRVIETARRDNDLSIVIVGGYSDDRGSEYGLPHKERYKRLRCAFEDYDDVMVALLDEEKAYEFSDPVGLAEYHDGVMEIVETYAPNFEHIRNYVGQKNYYDIVDAAYDDFETVLVERSYNELDELIGKSESETIASLSATRIREEPYKYWNYMDDAYKFRYRKAYVLAGAMSVGKSTISKMVSDALNEKERGISAEDVLDEKIGDISTPGTMETQRFPKGALLVPETPRSYTEGWRHSIESDLNERDYLAFIDMQLAAMEDALMSASDEQVVVIDTDGVITEQYIRNDGEAISKEYLGALEKVCGISVEWTREHASLIFILPNDVPFEFDGSRDGHLVDLRDEFRQQIIARYEEIAPGRVVIVPPGDAKSKADFILDAIDADFRMS